MGQAAGTGKASPPSTSLYPQEVSRQTHDGCTVGLARQRINLVMSVVLGLPRAVLFIFAEGGIHPITPYNPSCLLQLMLPSAARRGRHVDQTVPQGLLAALREKATKGNVVYKALQNLASTPNTAPPFLGSYHSLPPSLLTHHLGTVTPPL